MDPHASKSIRKKVGRWLASLVCRDFSVKDRQNRKLPKSPEDVSKRNSLLEAAKWSIQTKVTFCLPSNAQNCSESLIWLPNAFASGANRQRGQFDLAADFVEASCTLWTRTLRHPFCGVIGWIFGGPWTLHWIARRECIKYSMPTLIFSRCCLQDDYAYFRSQLN